MKVLQSLANLFPVKKVYAHCDIPCGVYDPMTLQMAAHTVLRMTQLLGEHKETHDVARMTLVKEEHGALVEKEIGTLKNDYFKPEHHESFPELKVLLEESVQLSVKGRQKIDLATTQDLLEKCLLVSEIFYKTKNVTPVRVKSLYPTEAEIVTYK